MVPPRAGRTAASFRRWLAGISRRARAGRWVVRRCARFPNGGLVSHRTPRSGRAKVRRRERRGRRGDWRAGDVLFPPARSARGARDVRSATGADRETSRCGERGGADGHGAARRRCGGGARLAGGGQGTRATGRRLCAPFRQRTPRARTRAAAARRSAARDGRRCACGDEPARRAADHAIGRWRAGRSRFPRRMRGGPGGLAPRRSRGRKTPDARRARRAALE